jgi:hypothetical protein
MKVAAEDGLDVASGPPASTQVPAEGTAHVMAWPALAVVPFALIRTPG